MLKDKKKDIKCVVWDLDNTLWDGTILEGDDVTLKPGMKDILHTLDSRGILMSIASKNDFDLAMEKLKSFGIDHYFLYPEIGWNVKSTSIEQIQKNLNIGMDTILFIDDQPFELDEVKSTHPSVTIVHAEEYKKLIHMERLMPRFITEDSSRRRLMYLDDQKRKRAEQEYKGPSTEFLKSLNMEFSISKAEEKDLLRVEELTLRTNQINSTGIHYSYDELKRLLNNDKYQLWVCELTDIYGSYGKIGLSLVEVHEESFHIKLLLMSCRTVSRGVGTVFLSFLLNQAKESEKRLTADFLRTEYNRQMLMTYKFAGFKEIERNEDKIVLENDLSVIQEYPPYINVVINNTNRIGVE